MSSRFSRIDKVLKATAKNYNLEAAVYKHQAKKNWSKVVGSFVEEAKDLTQVLDFKKGILTIACLSSAVASKIKLLANRIIDCLNQVLGKRVVFAIYVEV